MDDFRARKASDLLGAILSPQAAAMVEGWSNFFGFWGKAAGPNLAAHSRPVDVRNGIVFVEAEHPGWIQLLQMNQHRILETIRIAFPELGISGIAFRLAKDGSVPGTALAGAARAGTEVAPGDVATGGSISIDKGQRFDEPAPSVEQTLEHVEDEGFRSILSSLAQTLGKAPGDRGKPR
ncbi:MAG TPA: DUF721 domain-containing protein [bacterium]|nr:DUF721 domain-containing protein [bacterium]